jgi:hypothetical protein
MGIRLSLCRDVVVAHSVDCRFSIFRWSVPYHSALPARYFCAVLGANAKSENCAVRHIPQRKVVVVNVARRSARRNECVRCLLYDKDPWIWEIGM